MSGEASNHFIQSRDDEIQAETRGGFAKQSSWKGTKFLESRVRLEAMQTLILEMSCNEVNTNFQEKPIASKILSSQLIENTFLETSLIDFRQPKEKIQSLKPGCN